MSDAIPSKDVSVSLRVQDDPELFVFGSPEATKVVQDALWGRGLTDGRIAVANLPSNQMNPLQAYVDEQLDAYEFRGDGGDYTPDEQERALMQDFVNGLICDDEFLRLCATDPQCPRPAVETEAPLGDAAVLELQSLLQEAVTLAELGDITEATEAHGWGAWLKQSRAALAAPCRHVWTHQAKDIYCCENCGKFERRAVNGPAPHVCVCPPHLDPFGCNDRKCPRAIAARCETSRDATLVLRITTAYEQGFGQAPRDLENPYRVGTPESEAWNIGWQLGNKRSAENGTREPEGRRLVDMLDPRAEDTRGCSGG